MISAKGLINSNNTLNKFKKLFLRDINSFRLVGGYIRDYLIGLKSDDFDVATILSPEELRSFCDNNHIDFFDIGGIYGSIGIKIDDHVIEITPTRLDIKSYGRHADIEYIPDWQEDSKRRDFTINAFYVDFDENLYDYHDGLNDLEAKKIKFIGNGLDRIEEDYLRILRGYRFEAQLPGFALDQNDKKILENKVPKLKNLSRSRLKAELMKIFVTKQAVQYCKYFSDIGLWSELGLQFDVTEILEENWLKLQSRSAVLLISALYVDDNFKNLQSILDLSNKELMIVKVLTKYLNSELNDQSLCMLCYNYSKSIAQQLISAFYLKNKISAKAYNDYNRFISDLQILDFPISGNDLKALGISQGLVMGEILEQLKLTWFESKMMMDKDQLIQLAKKISPKS
jgi:poly(A) polymerase